MNFCENPAAFPRPASRGNNYLTGEQDVVVDPQQGMTLRDYFAAHAILLVVRQGPPAATPDDVARFAFSIADAMLAERTQPR